MALDATCSRPPTPSPRSHGHRLVLGPALLSCPDPPGFAWGWAQGTVSALETESSPRLHLAKRAEPRLQLYFSGTASEIVFNNCKIPRVTMDLQLLETEDLALIPVLGVVATLPSWRHASCVTCLPTP